MIGIFICQARHTRTINSSLLRQVDIRSIRQNDTAEHNADSMISTGAALTIFTDDFCPLWNEQMCPGKTVIYILSDDSYAVAVRRITGDTRL